MNSDNHPLDKVSRPVPEVHPPTMPSMAWNPWTDVRDRDDVTALNISFPYGPMPGWPILL
jgi:iduronate 2-sulfatase